MRYFQLIPGAGDHIGNDESGKERTYRSGEVVPSEGDLEKKWPEKFKEIHDLSVLKAAREGFGEGHSGPQGKEGQPQQGAQGHPGPHGKATATGVEISAADMHTIEAMSEDEIKVWAAEEGLDLKGAKTKQQMLTQIRRSVKG